MAMRNPVLVALFVVTGACSNGATEAPAFDARSDAATAVGGNVDLGHPETIFKDQGTVDGGKDVLFDNTGDVGSDAPAPACSPGEGCFLDPCQENSECQSGWCVQHLGENVCSQSCQEECPPGWACQQVAGTDPDIVYICVSDYANLCRPCAANSDCTSTGGAEDACIDYGSDGNFCGGPCSQDGECPWGFSCKEVTTVEGSTLQQCVNDTGECPCTKSSVALGLTTPCTAANDAGSCPGKRTCTAEGLSACDASPPAQETCNGIDDDCDDEADEPDLVEGNYINLCDDDNPCTEDKCMGQEGCVNEVLEASGCDDLDPCTVADHCVQGTCIGDPLECDDGNPCTDNICTAAGGCEYPANTATCDDGDSCTLADQCSEGQCTGTSANCDCVEDVDCGALEDGDLCNGTLVCDTAAVPYQCVVDPDTVVSCPEPEGENTFCLQSHCTPDTGECSLAPNHEGFLCDSGDACTVNDNCIEGACSGGGPVNCNDGNPCTEDGCETLVGCAYSNSDGGCDDGDICTLGDVCAEGICAAGAEILPCDDGNVCTTDSCAPGAGCIHELNTAPCQDSSFCTTNDHCQLGLCVSGEQVGCDDGNPCTDDGCNPAFGCEYIPNSLACDGGQCLLGQCVGECLPDCAGKDCGSDGCGGSCGQCAEGHVCVDGGSCICIPACQGKECGSDGCDGTCGNCPQGLECLEGQCEPVCFPACGGKQCGDDGCGGVCGTCGDGQVCFGATCCTPACGGMECGDDGCGGSCGQCPNDQFCVNAACKACAPHLSIAQSIWGSLQFGSVKEVVVSPDGQTVYVSTGNALLATTPDPQSGELVPLQLLQDGHDDVHGVNGASGLAVSPDGKNVYTARPNGNCIAALTRLPETGELKFLQYLNGPGLDLEHANDITVSPDGKQVYAVSKGQPYPSALVVFTRDEETGKMTYAQALKDGQSGGEDLTGAGGVAASPDGLNVYVAAPTDNAVTVFFRDMDTGLLGFGQALKHDQPGLDGLSGADLVTVSPDGKTVQVTGSSALVVFSRDAVTGHLAHLQTFKNGAGISGLSATEGVVITADGKNLYLAAMGSNTLTAFARNPDSGSLALQTAYDKTQPGFEGLSGVRRLAASPDGDFLYLGGQGALVTATRDGETGGLAPVATLENGQYGALALDDARHLALSQDGNSAYVATFSDHALVFDHDQQTGELSPVQDLKDGQDGVDGLNAAVGVAVSPDGANVYFAANYDHSVATFQRDPDSSELTYLQVLKNGLGGVSGLGEPNGLTVSPDGANVYVAAELQSVAVFARAQGDGQLTFVHAAKNGVNGVSGLNGAYSVAVSSDGKHLYAAASKESGGAFSRNPDTGELTFVQNIGSSGRGIAVTGDGKHVLLAASSNLKVYGRNVETGELALLHTLENGKNDVQGLSGVRSVAAGPDGETVYTAADGDSAVTVFVRDPASGQLFFYETVKTGPGGLLGPGAPQYLAIGPQGEHLYVVSGGWGGGSLTALDAWQCGQ